MLVSDNTSVRLSEMEKALPHVTMEEDHAALRRIDFALAEHGETTAKWRRRLSPTSHATAINCASPAPDRPSGRPSCSIIGAGGGNTTSTCDPSRF
jgi:hypothetical protein